MSLKTKIIFITLILFFILLFSNNSILAFNYIDNPNLTYKKLENGINLISGFNIGTKVSEIVNAESVQNVNVSVEVFDNNDNNITNDKNALIFTGCKVLITTTAQNINTDEQLVGDAIKKEEYIVVIYGDTTGDGKVNAVDALAIVKNKLGTDTFKDKSLEEAGRINESSRKANSVPAANDALAIIKYKLYPNKYNISQKMYQENNSNNQEDNNENNNNDNNIIDVPSPVATHGKLNVDGTDIIDKNGNKFQLKGVSTHGIAWFPQYVNQDAFNFMKNEWGINTVRLAMYSDPGAQYSRDNWNTVKQGVNYATNAGLYVIIDWHILSDGNPNTNKTEAIQFFKEMATLYKDNENVLYEICNEPNGAGVTWNEVIKPYAEEVITEIRKIDNDAIIICGTPNWDQDVDIVSQNPLDTERYKNIVYSLHFYSATHKEQYRNKLTTAINNGLPILVSEFSICEASGNGNLDMTEANEWIKLLNKNNIGYICWSLCNKDEAASILSKDTTKTTGWSDDDLSLSGKWFVMTLKSPKISYHLYNDTITVNIKDGNGIEKVDCSLEIDGNTQNYSFNADNSTVVKNYKNNIVEIEYTLTLPGSYKNYNIKMQNSIKEIGGKTVIFEKEYNK